MVLLVIASLLIRSVATLERTPLGFDPADVVSVRVSPSATAGVSRLQDAIAERLALARITRRSGGNDPVSARRCRAGHAGRRCADHGAHGSGCAGDRTHTHYTARSARHPGHMSRCSGPARRSGRMGRATARRDRHAHGPGRLSRSAFDARLRDGTAAHGRGVAAGIVLAAAVAPLVRVLLFGISPLDPFAFAMPAVVPGITAVLAAAAPALRAAAVPPAQALRD